jgi:hypothetical protein
MRVGVDQSPTYRQQQGQQDGPQPFHTCHVRLSRPRYLGRRGSCRRYNQTEPAIWLGSYGCVISRSKADSIRNGNFAARWTLIFAKRVLVFSGGSSNGSSAYGTTSSIIATYCPWIASSFVRSKAISFRSAPLGLASLLSLASRVKSRVNPCSKSSYLSECRTARCRRRSRRAGRAACRRPNRPRSDANLRGARESARPRRSASRVCQMREPERCLR